MPPKKKNYTLGNRNREVLHDVTLPSGETCQARRPGVQGLIAAGILDSFDELTALVQTEHVDKNSTRPPKVTPDVVQGLMEDPSKLQTGFEMIDRLVAYVVTQPRVWVDYQLKKESAEEFAERQQRAEETEALSVGLIDLEDKIFLLNWAVGGSADLKAFRERLQANLAGVAAIEGVQVPTE